MQGMLQLAPAVEKPQVSAEARQSKRGHVSSPSWSEAPRIQAEPRSQQEQPSRSHAAQSSEVPSVASHE